jgi:hypothetical protein
MFYRTRVPSVRSAVQRSRCSLQTRVCSTGRKVFSITGGSPVVTGCMNKISS